MSTRIRQLITGKPSISVESLNLFEVNESDTLQPSVEMRLIEASVAERNYDHSLNEYVQLENIAVGLESIADFTSANPPVGTVNRNMLKRTVHSFTDQLGYKQHDVSNESIRTVATEVWNAIKRAIESAMTFIRKWFSKITSSLPSLKKRAESIKAKAEKESGTIDKKDFELGGLASKLHVRNSVGKVTDISSSIDSLVTDVFGDMSTTAIKKLNPVVTIVKKGVSKLSTVVDVENTINDFNKELIKTNVMNNSLVKVWGGDKRYNDDGYIYARSDEYPGNKALIVSSYTPPTSTTLKDSLVARSSQLRNTKVKWTDFSEDKDTIKSTTKYPTIEVLDIIAVCDTVLSTIAKIEDYNKQFDKIEDYKKSLVKVGEEVTEELTDEDLIPEAKALGKLFITFVNYVGTTTGNADTKVAGYSTSICNDILTLCDKSLSNYKSV